MSKQRPGHIVRPGEIKAVMESALNENTARSVRDAAVVALLSGLGLNPWQISQLQWVDYDSDNGQLRFVDSYGRASWLALPATVHAPLCSWAKIRGTHLGPLFHPISKSDRIIERRLAPSSFFGLLADRASKAGVPAFSPHDIQRTQALAQYGWWSPRCRSLVASDGQAYSLYNYPFGDGSTTCTAGKPLLGQAQGTPCHAALRYLSHLIPSQRPRTTEALNALATILGHSDGLTFAWEKLCPDDLPSKNELLDRLGHSLLNRARKALNGVLREALLLGLMSPIAHEAVQKVSWNTIKTNSCQQTDGNWAPVERLFRVCRQEESVLARRDGALFALIWWQQLGTRDAIRFPNPRNVPQIAMIGSIRQPPTDIGEALARWRAIRGSTPGPMIYSVSRSSEVVKAPMTRAAVEAAFHRRCRKAGIAFFSADVLRRTSIKYHNALEEELTDDRRSAVPDTTELHA